jgi:predicted alpha/beta-fold hydrolase
LPNHRNGSQFVSTFDDNLTERGCNASDKVAIVVHGWTESIQTYWVGELIENLRTYRGGCIIFMDYSKHSMVNDYFQLVRKFNPISLVLLKKFHQLEKQGFDDDKMFVYGFSFGAQLAIHTGMKFGKQRIAEMDGKICD